MVKSPHTGTNSKSLSNIRSVCFCGFNRKVLDRSNFAKIALNDIYEWSFRTNYTKFTIKFHIDDKPLTNLLMRAILLVFCFVLFFQKKKKNLVQSFFNAEIQLFKTIITHHKKKFGRKKNDFFSQYAQKHWQNNNMNVEIQIVACEKCTLSTTQRWYCYSFIVKCVTIKVIVSDHFE